MTRSADLCSCSSGAGGSGGGSTTPTTQEKEGGSLGVSTAVTRAKPSPARRANAARHKAGSDVGILFTSHVYTY